MRLLNERSVEYVIIGAAAFPIHGYARATLDLDLFIRPTRDNAQKTLDAAVRNLEVIGEAVKKLPEEIRSKYTDLFVFARLTRVLRGGEYGTRAHSNNRGRIDRPALLFQRGNGGPPSITGSDISTFPATAAEGTVKVAVLRMPGAAPSVSLLI